MNEWITLHEESDSINKVEINFETHQIKVHRRTTTHEYELYRFIDSFNPNHIKWMDEDNDEVNDTYEINDVEQMYQDWLFNKTVEEKIGE